MSIGKTARTARFWKPAYRNLTIAGLCFLMVAALIHAAANFERRLDEQAVRTSAVQHAVNAGARLELEINSNIFLANGLAAYVSRDTSVDPDDLEIAMRALTGLGKHIRNIGVAVGYRLLYVYPPEGNESAIGLYYPDVPDQWNDIKTVIESRTTLVSGPLELVQGGQGIISRTPVFQEDGAYWGILSLVLDANSIFKAADLASTREGHRIALRKAPTGTADPAAFFGDGQVFRDNPVTINVTLPGNTWELGLVPIGGWAVGHQLSIWVEAALMALAIGFSTFLFLFLQNREKLRYRERKISAILDTSREGIVVLDTQDNVLEANAAACHMFSRERADIRGRPVSAIIDFNANAEHEISEIEMLYREGMEGDALRVTGLCARRGAFPLEVKVGQAQTSEKFLVVCALRDVSADVAYERKLIELATIDALTRAYNRRSFLEQAEKVVKLAARHRRPLSVLALDADHFKSINDTYGHAAGDEVLAALGRLIRDNIRDTDLFGRIGGEEFALLLPETSSESAQIMAAKILKLAEDTVVDVNGVEIHFTLSIGGGTAAATGYDLDALMQAADKALYSSKQNGRNRYSAWEPEQKFAAI